MYKHLSSLLVRRLISWTIVTRYQPSNMDFAPVVFSSKILKKNAREFFFLYSVLVDFEDKLRLSSILEVLYQS